MISRLFRIIDDAGLLAKISAPDCPKMTREDAASSDDPYFIRLYRDGTAIGTLYIVPDGDGNPIADYSDNVPEIAEIAERFDATF